MEQPWSGEDLDLPTDLRAALARARLEVDLDALAHNLAMVRRRVGPATRLLAVVKGDGYGLGAVAVARALVGAGADWLGAAAVEEAVALRAAGLAVPLLVLNPPHDDSAARLCAEHRLAATVQAAEELLALSRAAARAGTEVPVHVEVDVGFHRFGVAPDQLIPLLYRARQLPGLRLEGLCAHLPAATRPAAARRALATFRRLVERAEAAGLRPPLVHCAESALLLRAPDAQFDLVRIGNLLYGLAPSASHTELAALGLRPTWRLVARVLAVQTLAPGEGAGYRLRPSHRRRRLATLGLGLAHGLGLSPPGSWVRRAGRALACRLGAPARAPAVRAGGRTVPLRGEFMMSHTLFDASELELRPGQEVELLVPRHALSGHLPVVYLQGGRWTAVSWPARAWFERAVPSACEAAAGAER